MITLNDITIIAAAVCFIAILIILAKLSHQMNEFLNITKYIRKKNQETEEKMDWTLKFIKDKVDEVDKTIKNKLGNETDIKWKG